MNIKNVFVLNVIIACLSTLWVGCDVFTTQTVYQAPSALENLSQTFQSQNRLEYKMVESWRDAAGIAHLLPGKKNVFRVKKDSLINSVKWTSVQYSLVSLQEGRFNDTLYQETLWLRSNASGSWLTLDSSLGEKFFALKRANVLLGENEASVVSLKIGNAWDETAGAFNLHREVVGQDTLSVHHHLEVTWRIQETLQKDTQVLATGVYWYGHSGLIKFTRTIPDFEGRLDSGKSQGLGAITQAVELL